MEEQRITHETLNPNSYEFGKSGNRFKVFYTKPEELKAHITKLQDEGFFIDDGILIK